MGCKNSKAAVVRTVGSAGKKKVSPMDVTSPQKQTIIVDETNNSPNKKSKKSSSKLFSRNNSMGGSVDSILGDDRSDNEDGDRNGSAGSKRSQESTDSGLGDHNVDHFITENSNPDIVERIENEFEEKSDLDLCISGTACPRRESAKDKERMEEQRILATLREEGLITRPKTRASGGLAFEISEDTNSMAARPPRLAKLVLKISRKKKKKLTEEDIKAKLEKAEERKKQKEAERLDRINQLEKGTKSALDKSEEIQKQKEEETQRETQKKIDAALDNREKRLKELQEKLRIKNEHAEKVRQRKKLCIDTLTTEDNNESGLPNNVNDDESNMYTYSNAAAEISDEL